MRPLDRVSPLTRLTAPLAVHGKGPAAAGREVDDVRLLGFSGARAARRDRDDAYLRGEARRLVYRWLWQDAVNRLDGSLEELPGGYLALDIDGVQLRVYQQLVQVDDPVVLRFAGDKPATHAALTNAGVTVPEHLDLPVGAVERMAAFVREHGPCVVKPSRGGGSGHGVTGGVRTRDDLLRARIRAARWDPDRVLVEAQVHGRELRILVLDGEVLGVIRREPPSVVGDGRATVLELMRAENARRVSARGFAGIVPLRPSLDAHLALRRRRLDFGSVLRRGRRVEVATSTSASSERESATVTDTELHGLALRATAAIGARLASVEMIVPTGAAPGDATVVEVNTTPGLAHHYLVSDPTTVVPVAAHVARRLVDQQLSLQPRPVG